LNLNDPNDNLKLTIWGGMAGFERYKIRERTSRGSKMKSALPDTCTRKLPEGVVFKRHNDRVNSGVFGFNEYARTVIAPAFKRAAAGDRLMHIVRDMATQAKPFGIEIGYSNGFGNFGTKSLRDTLQSRWWLGEKPGNVHATFDTWKDPVHGLMTAEPIVSEALWIQVQDRLKRNTDSDNWSKLRPIKADFLVAGLMFCGKCGSKMYHKYKKAGKLYPIYECSNRYRGFGCDMPRVQAHGEHGTDEILAKTLQEKLTEPDIIAAAIQEAIEANQSTENITKLAVEQKAVRDLERKLANYTEALGEAESKEIRQSIGKKLEQIGMELATARTSAAMLAREMKASVDPRIAARHVQTVFAGFSELPKPEQRVLLEKYVSKIIYHQSAYQPVAKPGLADYSSLEVKMRLAEDADFQANSEGELCCGRRAPSQAARRWQASAQHGSVTNPPARARLDARPEGKPAIGASQSFPAKRTGVPDRGFGCAGAREAPPIAPAGPREESRRCGAPRMRVRDGLPPTPHFGKKRCGPLHPGHGDVIR
jgi:hypothetical protein